MQCVTDPSGGSTTEERDLNTWQMSNEKWSDATFWLELNYLTEHANEYIAGPVSLLPTLRMVALLWIPVLYAFCLGNFFFFFTCVFECKY